MEQKSNQFVRPAHLLSFGVALSLAGALFLCYLIPEQIVFGSTLIPRWSFFFGAAIVSAALVALVAHRGRQSIRFFLALTFTPILTLGVFSSLQAGASIKTELLWIAALWSWGMIEIFSAVVSRPLPARWWKALSCIALLTTLALAIAVRLERVPAAYPALLCVILLWIAVFRFLPSIVFARASALHQYIGIALVVLFIAWGAWLRISAINTFVLQNDEYFHVNTAVGYLATGEFRQWNFWTEEAEDEYMRTRGYTWQVAQSVKMFGQHEWAFRLPSLFWGLVLLVVLPLVTAHWTRSWMTAALTTAIVAFEPGFIWASTTARMYSWFSVMVLASVWLFWQAMRDDAEPRRRWKYCIASLVVTVFSIHVHVSALLLFGGMAVASALLWMRNRNERWYRQTALLFLVAGGIVGLTELLFPFLPLRFFALLTEPVTNYLQYPFEHFTLPLLGGVFVIGGIVLCRKQIPVWLVIVYGMTAPLTIYFAYFANRYGARKYSMFLYPLLYIVIAWAWHRVLRSTLRHTWLQYAFGVVAFVAAFVPIAIPGAAPSWILAEAKSDKSYGNIEAYDYAEGYAVLEQHAAQDDMVIILSPRFYYTTRKDLQFLTMPGDRVFSVTMLKALQATHARGWIVWPLHSRHLDASVEQYVRKTMQRLPAGDSRIIIYSWGI